MLIKLLLHYCFEPRGFWKGIVEYDQRLETQLHVAQQHLYGRIAIVVAEFRFFFGFCCYSRVIDVMASW